MRNTNNPKDFHDLIENFKNKLRERGYTLPEVNKFTQSVDHSIRKSLLMKHNNKSTKQVPLVFLTTFNPRGKGLNKILHKHWNIIEKDKNIAHLFPKKPIIAFRREKNIGEMITKAKI